MGKRKTWSEKLRNTPGLPKVEIIDEKMSKRWGAGTVVIPAPLEVDAIMGSIPEGKLITADMIRTKLAQKHDATIACPLTTGIFINIAAHAAEETAAVGKKAMTPYWRTLKTSGELNEKYPGGIDHQKMLLVSEGFDVIKKGKRYFVKDYQKYLLA